MQKFDLRDFLLSPRGRVGRSAYFSFSAIVWIYGVALEFGGGLSGLPMIEAVIVVGFYVLLLWPRLCVTAKRLHDIGLSAAWAAIILVPDALWLIDQVSPFPGLRTVWRVCGLLGVLFVVGLVVMPGKKTENRFGQVPAN